MRIIKEAIIYRYSHNLSEQGKRGYVGQTIHEKSRYRTHSKAKDNYDFHRAIRKFGWDKFNYEVLERLHNTTQDKIDEREIYWISHFDSFNEGYNMTEGGGGCSGFVMSEESRRSRRTTQLNKSQEEKDSLKLKISETYNKRTINQKEEANKNRSKGRSNPHKIEYKDITFIGSIREFIEEYPESNITHKQLSNMRNSSKDRTNFKSKKFPNFKSITLL